MIFLVFKHTEMFKFAIYFCIHKKIGMTFINNNNNKKLVRIESKCFLTRMEKKSIKTN